MKLFVILFLSLFLGKSCESQSKKDSADAVLEYTASTRGFYQKITIKNQTVVVSKSRNNTENQEEIKLSDNDWKELIAYFETINLEKLSTFKAPTQKRFYDGAAIASLKVLYKEKAYETVAFDDGFPPEEIKKLVDKINSFAKK